LGGEVYWSPSDKDKFKDKKSVIGRRRKETNVLNESLNET